jgi:hypothetical protein
MTQRPSILISPVVPRPLRVSRSSCSIVLFTFLSSFKLVSCAKINILTDGIISKYFSKQAPFSDFTKAYANARGENLTSPGPYIVNMVFTTPICVSEVLVQQTALGRGTSNVAQIELVYKDKLGNNIMSPTGDVTKLRSPVNNPTIIEPTPRCNIYGIDVQILQTTDGRYPINVRFMILGCYAPAPGENNYFTLELFARNTTCDYV